jgi:heme-degrading monooxygenase HmoA
VVIAVIFEVEPVEGRSKEYFDLAALLGNDLESVDGIVSVERFESLANPGKFLSLSFFEDEAAISAWRRRQGHRSAQARGRDSIFSNYRIRVAEVVRDYGMFDRAEAPDGRAVGCRREKQ